MRQISLSANFKTPRIIRGGWQLSSGHGAFDRDAAMHDIGLFARAGFHAVDCGDIYTGVEELLGDYIASNPSPDGRPPLQIHTKYVPDLDVLADVDFADTKCIIERSLARLRIEQLPMVQFHWWDFSIPRYVEVAQHLTELRTLGLIGEIGVTNFDGRHLRELIDAGVPVISNQMQYSVLDDRPSRDTALQAVCAQHGVKLLCYGTVAGGLIKDDFIGAPEPDQDANRSHTKYRLIIDEFGGWEKFQTMLGILRDIGEKHDVNASVVANAYILQQPHVAAVIVGARNGAHIPSMQHIDRIQLDADDIAKIRDARKSARGPNGDVFMLERDRDGPHGEIMRYNLNGMRAMIDQRRGMGAVR